MLKPMLMDAQACDVAVVNPRTLQNKAIKKLVLKSGRSSSSVWQATIQKMSREERFANYFFAQQRCK